LPVPCPRGQLLPMSFAEELTKVVALKRRESGERQRLADRWLAKEDQLLAALVAAFKSRCMREAEQLQSSATVSFAVLCREVEHVPRHVVSDSTYFVKDWGDSSAECWFYARHGTTATWVPGTPVLYAELLESMMPKFVERLGALGFASLVRESGTWKVTATWSVPGGRAEAVALAQTPVSQQNGSAAVAAAATAAAATASAAASAAAGKTSHGAAAVNGGSTNGHSRGAQNGGSHRVAKQGNPVAGAAPKSAVAPREPGGKRARSPTPTPTEGAPSEVRTAAPSEPTELAGDDDEGAAACSDAGGA